MKIRRANIHVPASLLALVLSCLAVAACDPVEGHEGGLFAPFGGGVVQQAGETGGGGTAGDGMELPDPEDFVHEDPTTPTQPLVVDTGGPPAVTVGDDDSADGLSHLGDAVEPTTGSVVAVEPVTPETVTPMPVPIETHPVQTVPLVTAPVPTYPVPTTNPAIAAPTAMSETALLVSAPLSEILLVASIPDANPPRAIVRFPGGEERVVQVGDLVGDSGAKVTLIGAGFIKLAELTVDEPDRPALVTHYLHLTR